MENNGEESGVLLKKLRDTVEGKKVQLVCHWDADGVTSGALLYHLIKEYAAEIFTLSKGEIFQVFKDDVNPDAEIIICADIAPSEELKPERTIYIDHHPFDDPDKFLLTLHNDQIQSCSLLIWEKLLQEHKDPYYIFLTLLGYFGDGGDREEIPLELQMQAQKLIPEMMQKYNSYYNGGYYFNIERFVSALNTGKRMLWRGDIPLNLLIDIEEHQPFTSGNHHTAQLLETFKAELRNLYNMDITIHETEKFNYSIIECPANIQGVLCARHGKEKPIIVMNKVNGNIIGSMRVPDHIDFDAGKFLDTFNGKVESYIGGGHEKAGGFTIKGEKFDEFSKLLFK